MYSHARTHTHAYARTLTHSYAHARTRISLHTNSADARSKTLLLGELSVNIMLQ